MYSELVNYTLKKKKIKQKGELVYYLNKKNNKKITLIGELVYLILKKTKALIGELVYLSFFFSIT